MVRSATADMLLLRGLSAGWLLTMGTVAVLVAAVVLMSLVLYWSGRHGGRGRIGGTSLRRGPGAHTTSTGRAKISYATKEEAQEQARRMSHADGVRMSVYQCVRCAKWHLGH